MRFILKTAPLLGLAALAAAVPQTAQAQTNRITISGTLSEVGDLPAQSVPFDSTVKVGTPFTYSFLVDDSEPKNLTITPGLSEVANYNTTGPMYGPTITFGDVTFTPDASSVNAVNVEAGLGGDNDDLIEQISSNGAATGLANGYVPDLSAVFASTYNTAVYPNVNDPAGEFTNSEYVNTYSFDAIVKRTTDGSTFAVASLLNPITVTVTPVAPEPSSVATVGIVGLFVGGLMLKARKRRSVA